MSSPSAPTLTSQVKAGGCASKLSPKILDQVLSCIPRVSDPRVLVGYDTLDDAGIFQISDEIALVQTVDFFTPVVDDPYTFGAIAAANALSDVYAMGGRPLSALSILAWPAQQDIAILEQIFKGGAEKIHEAGAVILGGHSVSDAEIKFGYAVTGSVHPKRYKANSGARPGDVLMFTKRIGTGVISTALKKGIAEPSHVNAAVQQMSTLNRAACEAMLEFDVHGVTDVTGFGLMGHAREMAVASGITCEIEVDRVQYLPGAIEYSRQGALSGGLRNNQEFAACAVELAGPIPQEVLDLMYDPQTSGGLLISMPPLNAAKFETRYPLAYRIGQVLPRGEKPVRLV